MGRHHRHGTVRSRARKVKSEQFPQVFVDRENDFASIKIDPGIESRSYVKDGVVFFEDKKGRVIEVQILNLSQLLNLDRPRTYGSTDSHSEHHS